MTTTADTLAILDDPEALRDQWLAAMALREVAPDEFEPEPHARGFHRVFGGRSMAHLVVATSRTVPAEMVPHSLQVTFMRPGKGDLPTRYSVTRSRDGRSFADRRVSVTQNGATLFEAFVSYGRAFDGLAYAQPMPEAPSPEALPELPRPPFVWHLSLEERIRMIGLEPYFTERRGEWAGIAPILPPPPFMVWQRPCAPLPEDPVIHAAALAWVSDGPIIGVVGAQVELPDTPDRGATLNQSIWWHAPPRWEGWLLYACEARAAFADRGLQMGRMYAADGTLLATVAQETLFPTRV